MAAGAGGWKSLADISRAGRSDDSVCQRSGIYAYRVAADHGASVRRVMGISDDWVLFGDQPIWNTNGVHGVYRSLPSGWTGRNSGLDAGTFPTRRTWAG